MRLPPASEAVRGQDSVRIGSSMTKTVVLPDRRKLEFSLTEGAGGAEIEVGTKYRATGSRIWIDSWRNGGAPDSAFTIDARQRSRFWAAAANHALETKLAEDGASPLALPPFRNTVSAKATFHRRRYEIPEGDRLARVLRFFWS